METDLLLRISKAIPPINLVQAIVHQSNLGRKYIYFLLIGSIRGVLVVYLFVLDIAH